MDERLQIINRHTLLGYNFLVVIYYGVLQILVELVLFIGNCKNLVLVLQLSHGNLILFLSLPQLHDEPFLLFKFTFNLKFFPCLFCEVFTQIRVLKAYLMHLLANAFVVGRVYGDSVTLWS